jgi:hypothetical protein
MQKRRFLIGFLMLLMSPLVHGQNDYIPFQRNQLWGLSDSARNIILEPAFDSISPNISVRSGTLYPPGYCVMMKGDKDGVLYNGKPIIGPSYDSISINIFIKGFVGRGYFLHSLKGDKILPDTVKQLTQLVFYPSVDPRSNGTNTPEFSHYHLHMYKVEYTNNRFDLIVYDSRNHIVKETILQNVSILEYKTQGFSGIINTVYSSSILEATTTNYKLNSTDERKETGFYKLDFDNRGFVFNMSNLSEQEGYKMFPRRSRYSFNDSYRCGTSIVEEVWRNQCGYPKNQTFIRYTKDSVYIIKTNGTRNYNRSAALTFDCYHYTYDTVSAIFNTFNNLQSIVFQDSLNNHYSNFFTYKEQDKYGLITPFGTTKAIYDSVLFGGLRAINGHFMVKLGDQYQFINGMGTVLVEPFDTARGWGTSQNAYLIIRNDKQGLYSLSFGFVLECEYDSIAPIESGILTEQDGKYGIYFPVLELEEPCHYSYPIKSFVTINKEQYLKLYDGDKFVGYAKKGILYF